jgi:hypothetical protein
MKLAVIIPTLSNRPMLKKLVGQIDKETEYTLIVLKGNTIAKAWNDGIKAGLAIGCTHFAIFNDDIELCKGWWEACQAEFNKGAHMVCLDQPCPIELTGWFFVLNKECVERVGLFDEQFTLTSEDTDYLFRFKDAGLKLAKVDLPVVHVGSTTVKKLDREKFKEIRLENWEKLRKKYPNRRMPSQR